MIWQRWCLCPTCASLSFFRLSVLHRSVPSFPWFHGVRSAIHFVPFSLRTRFQWPFSTPIETIDPSDEPSDQPRIQDVSRSSRPRIDATSISSRERRGRRGNRAAADATCFDTSGDSRTCTGAHAAARVAKARGEGLNNCKRTRKIWETAKSTWIARKTASKVERMLTRKIAFYLLCGRLMGVLTCTRRHFAMEDVVLRPGGVAGGLGPFAMAPPGMKRRPDGGFEKVKLVSWCKKPSTSHQACRITDKGHALPTEPTSARGLTFDDVCRHHEKVRNWVKTEKDTQGSFCSSSRRYVSGTDKSRPFASLLVVPCSELTCRVSFLWCRNVPKLPKG